VCLFTPSDESDSESFAVGNVKLVIRIAACVYKGLPVWAVFAKSVSHLSVHCGLSRFGLCDASLWYKQCELNNRLFTVWFISFGLRLSLDTAAEALPQAVVVCVLKAS